MASEMWMGTYYRNLLLKRLRFNLQGKKALEIGCHDGFLLSNVKAEKKMGIDLEPIKAYSGIEYIKGDFLDYDFKDKKFKNKKFDMILSIEVMEHVKDPEKFMRNVDKLIPKNGKVLLSVPSKNIRIFPCILQSYIYKRWGHYYRKGFSIKELHHLLKNNIPNKEYKMISWNCPFWRTFYIPLKMFWKVSPELTKKLLKLSISLDMKFRKGKKGFLFVVIS